MEDIAVENNSIKSSGEKIDNRYIFPNWLADTMSKVDFRTQNESSLLSQSLLIIGMVFMCIYMILYGGQTLYFKILLAINLICGIVFMSSYLITTYQQYKSYMDTMGISTDAEKIRIKASGNIFKRINKAWQNRKRKKIDAKAIVQIGNLMEKSGMAKETSPEEKELEAEIEELMGEGKQTNTNLKGGQN